jgi:hypothetical protein
MEKNMPTVSKGDLYKLIDSLPEGDTLAAKRFLERLLNKAHDPLVLALLNAPEDDEPLDKEDLEHLEEAESFSEKEDCSGSGTTPDEPGTY